MIDPKSIENIRITSKNGERLPFIETVIGDPLDYLKHIEDGVYGIKYKDLNSGTDKNMTLNIKKGRITRVKRSQDPYKNRSAKTNNPVVISNPIVTKEVSRDDLVKQIVEEVSKIFEPFIEMMKQMTNQNLQNIAATLKGTQDPTESANSMLEMFMNFQEFIDSRQPEPYQTQENPVSPLNGIFGLIGNLISNPMVLGKIFGGNTPPQPEYNNQMNGYPPQQPMYQQPMNYQMNGYPPPQQQQQQQNYHWNQQQPNQPISYPQQQQQNPLKAVKPVTNAYIEDEDDIIE